MSSYFPGFLSPYPLSPLERIHQFGSMIAPPLEMLFNGHPISSDPVHLVSLYMQKDLNLIGGPGMGPIMGPIIGPMMAPYFPQQQSYPQPYGDGFGLGGFNPIMLPLMMALSQFLSKPTGAEVNGETGPHDLKTPGNYGRNAASKFHQLPDTDQLTGIRYTPEGAPKFADLFGYSGEFLKSSDSNKDGKTSTAEFKSGNLDFNRDGFVSADEFAANVLNIDANGDGFQSNQEHAMAGNQQDRNLSGYLEGVKEIHNALNLASKYAEFNKTVPSP